MVAVVNTLAAGAHQRAHRHNGAAITLCLEAEGVYSTVEGERCDWSHGLVVVTPPCEVHSITNAGPRLMRCFTVQDSGLHYYARTPGFSFAE
jgi:gentisate 1,2-dioxygenase